MCVLSEDKILSILQILVCIFSALQQFSLAKI